MSERDVEAGADPAARRIVPVILSGGSGTRLWPMSRGARPKQLLSLTAAETMLQLTARRTAESEMLRRPADRRQCPPRRRDRGAARGGWHARRRR